ncbi:MAG: PH domain-containing protein [Candidatus Peribacter sp.]|nr:PH domain-containing protein [Candidatus Peribacter sp.]
MRSLLDSLNRWFFKKHLEDDEEVRLYLHTHWRLGLVRLFWPTAAFIVSWVFLAIAPFLIIFYFVALASVLSLVWWVRNFFDYFLDAWLVTNQALIDVKWHGWFHRTATKVLFSDIQGVSYEIKGISGTLFRYGTISVEKVSTGGTISLDNVPHPREVAGAILQNMELYLHGKNLKDAKRIQELLSGVVSRELSLGELKAKKIIVKS